jgi:hypothetical protein
MEVERVFDGNRNGIGILELGGHGQARIEGSTTVGGLRRQSGLQREKIRRFGSQLSTTFIAERRAVSWLSTSPV